MKAESNCTFFVLSRLSQLQSNIFCVNYISRLCFHRLSLSLAWHCESFKYLYRGNTIFTHALHQPVASFRRDDILHIEQNLFRDFEAFN